MTVLLYVRRKEWPLRSVTIDATHERVDRNEDESTLPGQLPYVDLIRQHIRVEGPLSEEQRERISYIAGRCPVRRTMENSPRIVDEVEVVG